MVGTLIAWVLVRDDFRGKWLVNAVIDLPFALPTIVASIVLLSLYGPQSPIEVHLYATRPALVIALLFVTLPFVVRSVQPGLMEVDREAEEAAASLGASNLVIFRRVILPALMPALLSGAGLAFARAVGEFGSVVLIGGGIPRDTEVASQYIAKQIEIDRPETAAAVSVVLLLIAFAVLVAPPVAGRASPAPRAGLTMAVGPAPASALRCASRSATSWRSLMVPLGMIFYRTFEDGFVAFWEQVTTPASISAINLSLIIVAIVVPLNVVFGVITALALARGRFRGKRVDRADGRPPVRSVAGGGRRVADPALGGRRLARRAGRARDPGHLLAPGNGDRHDLRDPSRSWSARWSRCCTRSATSRSRRRPRSARRGARRSGASRCRRSAGAFSTAWCSRWRARSGEFGALIVVAGGVSGESQTLTLLVHARYIDDHNTFGAYAAATVLMGLALLTLVLMTLLNKKREPT